jgi:hypothetical protein
MPNLNNEIVMKIEDFYKKKITKTELGKWAKKEYYQILTGGYIFIDKLVAYNFLKEISEVLLEEDDRSDQYPTQEVRLIEILTILKGEKDIIFSGEIRIFPKYLSEELKIKFSKIKKIVESQNNIEELNIYYRQVKGCNKKSAGGEKTIINILENFVEDIVDNLATLSSTGVAESSFGLYLKDEDRSIKKRTERLLKLLDCILGESSFGVCIEYKQGYPSVSIAV